VVLLRTSSGVEPRRRTPIPAELEAKKLAASMIHVRLAAVRRSAYEAADTGLLSPKLVAGN